jgi:PAS domain S-box-containing protein
MILSLLLAATSSLVVFLSYKVRSLQKEQERLRREGKEDSKVLFLNSRYASMGETIGNIAHQWKQPLNAIGTIQNSIKAALIFQGEISKEKLLHSVEISFKLIQHLAETIDTFYSFLSQQNSEKMSFTVADELEKVRKITEYSFENSHITLNYELDINPTIQGNANEFTHAMLNLIFNAKDAFDNSSVDAPLITIRVSDGDKICHITVSDNAGGIRLKPIEIVFDLHTTTKEEGSGLGLFMTKNIIENRFGGNISVKNVKGGACFTIALPYAEYGEHYVETVTPDEKLTLDRINLLSRKIIELEEVEQALKKWADIFEQAQWGIVMCGADTMTLDLMNPAFAQMHGFEVNELIRKPMESIFAPECRDHVQCILQTLHQESHYAFESIHIRKDGSRFPVAIDITAVKDDNNNVIYRIANVRDITAHKEAEERLLLKKFALNHIKDAVFIVDENARFHYVNDGACIALGYSREEFMDMSIGDVDPDWPSERWSQQWNDLKKVGSITMELRHRRCDGILFPVEVSANYIEYEGTSYNMAIARDITERLLLEEQKDNERMKLFFERQLVGMAITSPEYGWIQTNEKLQQMLGYTHEELVKLTWTELTYPDDLRADLDQFEKLLRGEIEDYMLEKRFMRKDGSIVYTNLAVSCVRNDDRTVNYVLALLEDITERKAVQEALADRERELRSLADSSPGMMGSFYLRPDGSTCMPYVSPNIIDLFGLAPEDVADDSRAIFKLYHPDDNERIFETIAESARTMSVWHQEFRIIHPSKGERWMESNTMPQPHPQGGIVWYGYIHDITERKKIEEKLTRSETSLKEAQKIAKIGSWELELPCQKLTWSDETYRIFEIDPEQKGELHTTFYDSVHPDDREIVNKAFEESLKTKLPFEIVHRIVIDGRIKYLLESCETQYDTDGNPVLSIGTVQDITERKKAEELIQTLNATLEKRVIERTFQLEEAVTKLHDEINQKNMLQQEQLLLEERLSKIAASVPGVNYIFEQTVEGIV